MAQLFNNRKVNKNVKHNAVWWLKVLLTFLFVTLTWMVFRLGITETVNSPTFTIVKEYYSGRIPLYHFDVYRIGDPDELFNIGADEYFDGSGLCVVEWANMVEEELPEDSLYIYIEYGEKEGERIYKCTF